MVRPLAAAWPRASASSAGLEGASTVTSQLTMMCTMKISSQRCLQPEIMISHGDALRRDLRLRISGLEARLLPGQATGPPVSELLRGTAQLRGDQLHIPPPAFGHDARKLGGSHEPRFRFRRQSEHADYAYPAPEKRRGGDRVVSEEDRPAAHRAPPRPDSVSVAPRRQVRPGPAAQLPGSAARRH